MRSLTRALANRALQRTNASVASLPLALAAECHYRRADPRMSKREGPSFITVDLEVWSKTNLTPLADALRQRSFVVYVGKVDRKFLASFEAHGETPEETIWRLLRLVKPLRGLPKKLWQTAEARVFNIGFESGNTVALLHETPPGSGVWKQRGRAKLSVFETSLGADLLRAVADVRGTVTTSIYPPRREVRATRKRTTDA